MLPKVNVKTFFEYYYFNPKKAPNSRKKTIFLAATLWSLSFGMGPLICGLVSWKRGKGFIPKEPGFLSKQEKKVHAKASVIIIEPFIKEILTPEPIRAKNTFVETSNPQTKSVFTQKMKSPLSTNEVSSVEAPSPQNKKEKIKLSFHLGDNFDFDNEYEKAQELEDAYNDEDNKEAHDIYLKLALKNHVPSMYALARLYDLGMGVTEDVNIAKKWFMKAASYGCAKSMFALGEMEDFSWTERKEWYRKGALLGHVESMIELADLLHREAKRMGATADSEGNNQLHANLVEARKLYISAAQKDILQAHAFYMAGEMIYNAEGGEGNDFEARKYYEKAALLDHLEAMKMFADMLAEGIGGPCLPHEAEEWDRLIEEAEKLERVILEDSFDEDRVDLRAENASSFTIKQAPYGIDSFGHSPIDIIENLKEKANQGDISSMISLGIRYLEGKDVEQNYTEAEKLLLKAQKEGASEEAMYLLGTMALNGLGKNPDINIALGWFIKAADNGSTKAMLAIGDILFNGTPEIELDREAAFHWFEKAKDGDNPEGAFRMAEIYNQGLGKEKNLEKARALYEEAAVNNFKMAIPPLVLMLERGEGGPKNLAEVKMWKSKLKN